MTTQSIVQRQVTATIQSLAQTEGTKGTYETITLLQTGMKFPVKYIAWDVGLVAGFKAGDIVTLTLQQGKVKNSPPQAEKDWYWDVVGVAYPEAPPAKSVITVGPGPGDPKVGLIKSYVAPVVEDPWHRYIAWGDLVAQARLMVQDTAVKGETGVPIKAPAWIEYGGQFYRALSLICSAIRQEMVRGVSRDELAEVFGEEGPSPSSRGPQEPQERPSEAKPALVGGPEAPRPALEKTQGDQARSAATYARLEALFAKVSGLSNYAEIRQRMGKAWKARQERLGLSGPMMEWQCLAWIADIENEQAGK